MRETMIRTDGRKLLLDVPRLIGISGSNGVPDYRGIFQLFFYYYYLVSGAIGTAATPGLLCQPRVIVKMIVEKQMESRLPGETEVLGGNLPQRHFCPSQNPT
jgi:hypothetical protein